MKNLKQIQSKVNLFKDFKKVINIQKILVMKEVSKWKKIAKQVALRSSVFNNYLIDLNNKSHVFDPNYFDKGRLLIPKVRDLHIVFSNPNSDKISEYSNKLLIEFVKQNHSEDDLYIVVGKDIFDLFNHNNLMVVKSFVEEMIINEVGLYERLSHLVFQGFNNMLYHKVSFLYFDIIKKQPIEIEIFPFIKEKIEISNDLKDGLDDDIITLLSARVKRASFYKDISSVGQGIAQLAIQNRVYSAMVEYKIALFLRELQILDDKEKNIDEEIVKLELLKQRIRKENITNELIVNSMAFKLLSSKDSNGEVKDKGGKE